MWTDGQRTKTNPKTSPEQSAIFQLAKNVTSIMKTAPPPWQPYIYKTNLFTKFHDDWAKNVTSSPFYYINIRKTAPSPWQPCFSTETKVLTKFHENLAKNVTSRVLTCFHYIHIEKNAPPTGGHVFSPIWTIFELVREINKTNLSTVFELDRDFIGTKLLTKFHEDRTINVASRVFTNKC
ncbi:hypothetical protein DPMN_136312 [Dreissena polymorpha]|uniref:Uncharacterized protein n=1 Tax=Dreissena polymorpha TaxID=45954 RepID=A0A9D4JFE9_DREPO|nr:hypothetical protein DPMN_136312 [Dreissena polymorpha]